MVSMSNVGWVSEALPIKIARQPLRGNASLTHPMDSRISSNITRPTLLFLLILLTLNACGKRGSPQPPGSPDQVTYPKVYPTQ